MLVKEAKPVYKVMSFGDKWGVVKTSDPHPRPVGEKLYTQRTHAHRRCRSLNNASTAIDALIEQGDLPM